MREETNDTFLKPFFILLRLAGVELNPYREFSKKGALCSSLISFLMLLANVWSNFYFTVYVFYSLKRVNSPDEYHPAATSQSSMWSMSIDFGSYDFMVITNHAVLLCLFGKTEWKSLMKNLRNLNQEVGTVSTRIKKRRIVMAGIIFLIIVRRISCCLLTD